MRTHQALTRETVIKPALKSMNCVTSANLSKAEPPTGQMREAAVSFSALTFVSGSRTVSRRGPGGGLWTRDLFSFRVQVRAG